MKLLIALKYFICIIYILSVIDRCHSSIINIPEDSETIDEGIRMATNGDIIQVNQHDVFLRQIHIIDKDLKIIGTLHNEKARVITDVTGISNNFSIDIPPESDLNVLTIKDSIVEFRNLEFLSTNATSNQIQVGIFFGITSPWQVLSGKMIFDNVIFHGLIKIFSDSEISNSTIYGDSEYEYRNIYMGLSSVTKRPFPALHIRQQESTNIRIINSEIICNTDIGTRAIVIEEINNGNFDIINSIISSGNSGYTPSATLPYSYWDGADNQKVLAGILVVNSTYVKLEMTNSISKGGDGHYTSNNLLSPSGPGIEIINSEQVKIKNGKSIGHNGHKGSFIPKSAILNTMVDTYIHGGDGGNGLYITNSTVHLYNHTAIGGKGGDGDPEHDILPGQDGAPIYQDENSEVIIETNVHDWMLYSN